MALTISQLKGLSDQELVARHDQAVENTAAGVGYYLDEIRHREQVQAMQELLAELCFSNEVQSLHSQIVTKLLKNIENELQYLNGSRDHPRVDMNPLVVSQMKRLEELIADRRQQKTP